MIKKHKWTQWETTDAHTTEVKISSDAPQVEGPTS